VSIDVVQTDRHHRRFERRGSSQFNLQNVKHLSKSEHTGREGAARDRGARVAATKMKSQLVIEEH
jgi:hypothetical protein